MKYDSHFNKLQGVAPLSRSVICLFCSEFQSSPDVDRDRSTVANEEEKRSCVKGSLTLLSPILFAVCPTADSEITTRNSVEMSLQLHCRRCFFCRFIRAIKERTLRDT